MNDRDGGPQKLQEQLKVDFLLRTFGSSLFQVIIAATILWQSYYLHEERLIVSVCLVIIMIGHSLRFLISISVGREPTDLLKIYLPAASLSYLAAVCWGVVAALSISEFGPVGTGLAVMLTCIGVISAISFTASPILLHQRAYTLIICLPLFSGIAIYFHSIVSLVPLSILLMMSLFCVDSAKKENSRLKLIYEQKERIRSDLLAARDIQRSLLPNPQQRLGPFDIDVLYRPSEDLSGDFFEMHVVEKTLLFYIADVTSHGTAAAQVTYLLKGIFKNILPERARNIELPSLVRRLAVDFSAYGLPYSVSLFVGSLDSETGELTFVGSNFPSPILKESSGSQEVEVFQNPLVDAMTLPTEYTFTTNSVRIPAGAFLYIFTDGAYEFAEKSGRLFGSRSFLRFIKNLKDSPKAEWQSTWLAQLAEIKGSDQFEDDITVMRIGRDS